MSEIYLPLKLITTSKPFELARIDIVELGLSESGNRYVVVAIDHFTKSLEAYPVADKTAGTITTSLFERWI